MKKNENEMIDEERWSEVEVLGFFVRNPPNENEGDTTDFFFFFVWNLTVVWSNGRGQFEVII